MRLVLLGPPGSGKGTQAKRLAGQFDLVHLATGDLFRAAMSADTKLGKTVKKYISRGNLVPDSIVNDMVQEWMTKHQGAHYVFDGYPRTVEQAQSLEQMSIELKMPLDMAVDIRVADDAIVDRAVGRMVCSECGAIYHLTAKPPRVMGVCDICRGVLKVRDDDQPSTVRHRLAVYHRITEPVRRYYQAKGMLQGIDGEGTPEIVNQRLQQVTGL